jgi:hypothetical protein
MTLADMGISGAPKVKWPWQGSEDEDRPRRLTLSDLGIDLGDLQFKVPDWVPGWGGEPERAPVSAHDPGIDDSTVPMMGPRYDPRARVRRRGSGADIAAAKMEEGPDGTFMIPPRKPEGIAAAAPALTDKEAQAALKTAVGAEEDSDDAPDWAIPMIMAGLGMAASRNPSVLGALGEGGIAALSSYIDQKRADTEAALEAEKIAREIARDEETARHNVATEETAAANAAGLSAYRQAQAAQGERRTKAYEDRTRALNARGGASGGSATERIVSNIMAEAKAAGKPMSYAQAVRLAHGANLNDTVAIERLAQNAARAEVGHYGSAEQYTAALEKYRAKYGALSGGVTEESDPLGLGEDEDPLSLFAEE